MAGRVHLQRPVDDILPAASKLASLGRNLMQLNLYVLGIPMRSFSTVSQRHIELARGDTHHSSKLTCQCSWRMAYDSKYTSAPDIVVDIRNTSLSRTLAQQPLNRIACRAANVLRI